MFPILPVLGLQLGLSGLMIGLILSANRITRLLFNPVTGALLDRFGARWPVAVGMVIEALGTLMFSAALFSDTPGTWFLAGRVVWGVGSSLLLVGAMAAVMMISAHRERGRLTARVRTAISLGLPAGLVIGGLTADLASSNAAFLCATVLSLFAAGAALMALPRGRPPVDDAPRSGDAGQTVAWRELLTTPVLQVIWGANALLFFAVSGVLLATVAVLVETRGLQVFGLGAPGSAGLLMAVLMVWRAGASLAAGSYLDHVRNRTTLLLPSMGLVVAGFSGLALASDVVTVALALLAIGAGSGGLTIPLITLIGDLAPRHLHGRALSIYQWSSDLGGALGPAAGLHVGYVCGFGVAYMGVAGVLLFMSLPLIWLARRERGTRRR